MRFVARSLFLAALVAVPLPGQSADYRLGDDVVPVFQAVKLRIDPEQESYSGSVVVELAVRNVTNEFRFHAEEMNLTRVELRTGALTFPLQHRASERSLIHVTSPHPLPLGRHTLTIDFTNEFEKRAVGLYKMTAEKRAYAFTQFEATDARKAFPCWDEPGFKIPYQLTISVPAALHAVSNTPVEKESESDGWKTTLFQRTKPLPTYLIAIAAGPLDFAPIPGLSVPGRIVAPAGQAHLGAAAASVTPAILTALENYFGMKYPYEKLDFIAIPEYWPGAMEHPGAVTFHSNLLLLDERATAGQKRSLNRVIAHELAHMWFGNLVTMEWWDDLWLNESFADWMGDKITEQLFPHYRLGVSELQGIQGTMSQDARPTTLAIRRPVDHPEDSLGEVGLAYNKGKAILSMFENYIGEDAFRRGVIKYLGENLWRNATADDLWRTLGKESGADLPKAMSTFLDQPGLPMIEARLGTGGEVTLTQRRFLNQGTEAPPLTWHVPVAIRYSDGTLLRAKTVMLDAPSKSFKLDSDRITWIMPQADAIGYYRWSVPATMLSSLARNSQGLLNSRERVGFIGNLSALLDADVIDGDEYLAALAEFADDADPQVISALIGALGKIELTFVTPELEDEFAAWVRRTLRPVLGRFGMTPRPGEDETVSIFRPQLIGWLADEGRDREVIAEAKKLAAAYLRDSASVDSAIAGVMLQAAAYEGDQALFDEIRRRFENAKIPADRSRYLNALAAFRDPKFREVLLQYALEGPLRANELFAIPYAMSETAEGRDRLYRFMTENWDKITPRLPPFFISNMPFIASGCEPERVEAARKFFADPAHRAGETDKEMEKVANQVRDCARLRAREGAAVAAYLRSVRASPSRAGQ